MNNIEHAEMAGEPKRPLTGQGMIKVWDAQRQAAEQVATTCVHHGLAGIQWEPINLPGIPFAWYAALLTHAERSVGEARLEQLALLAGGDRRPWRRWRWDLSISDYVV